MSRILLPAALLLLAGCGGRRESAAPPPVPEPAAAAVASADTAHARPAAPARPPRAFDRSLEPGIAQYRDNRIPEALATFRAVLEKRKTDPDAHAWVAEAARRGGEYENAEREAREALRLDPRHAFAHQVLGETYMPQYGWAGANADSAWSHLLAALACDPTDGNPALEVWFEGLRRGDRAAQERSLRIAMDSGFLPPALLAFAGWTIRDVPPRAVYLVSGDALTHALIAFQASGKGRPDVTIVVASLLDAGWYRRHVTGAGNVKNPFGRDTLDRLEATIGPGQVVTTPSQKLAQRWAALAARGQLGRPFAVSTTVTDVGFAPAAGASLVLRGAFWEVGASDRGCVRFSGILADTAATAASLRAIDPAAFAGAMVHPRERSRSRLAAPERLRTIPLVTAGVLGRALAAAGRGADARAWLGWMERYDRAIGGSERGREQIEQYRTFLASAP